jgi:wyosine [tRNA(Phe)-imidazoG37] synthetase (radical SAM superfamily)
MKKPERSLTGMGPKAHVFGPVLSRRLGLSLGVDPIPEKSCNWNCVYCQLGRTVPVLSHREEFFSAPEILLELWDRLVFLDQEELDWVTIVGSGEPLLNSGIGELIRGIKGLTKVPVAIITNGSLLSRAEVRDEVLSADAVLPTLDAGSADLFRRVNRPHPGISFEDHLRGLVDFRRVFTGKIFLEVMLMKGVNDSEEEIRLIAERAAGIDPDEIHISLPERPPAEPWVVPADAEGVARAVRILGGAAKVLRPGEGVLALDDQSDALERLISVIGRHPLKEGQVMDALASFSSHNKKSILQSLETSEQVKRVHRHGDVFWVSDSARFPEGERG